LDGLLEAAEVEGRRIAGGTAIDLAEDSSTSASESVSACSSRMEVQMVGFSRSLVLAAPTVFSIGRINNATNLKEED
jgi:hypothetical protein